MQARAHIRATVLLSAFLVGAVLAGVPELHAQDSAELSAIYGRGVHAYFANQSHQAEQHFTQVIQAGSSDPRVFYFRAVVRMRMGRQHEAESDMQVGANYEARNPGRIGSISKALERVQGHSRRKLEKFRRQARLNRVQIRRHQSHARYETLQRRETQILRKEVDVPLGQLINPSPQMTNPTDVPTATKQMDPSVLKPMPAEMPAKEPVDSEDNFFGNDSEPAEMPMKEMLEDAEGENDFFQETPAEDSTPPADSMQSTLTSADKVKPSKLLGILGRVVGRTMPWNQVQLPSMGPPGFSGKEAPNNGGFELGPIEEPAADSETTDEDALFGADELFGQPDASESSEGNVAEDSEPSEMEEVPAEEDADEDDFLEGL